ncbi:MAG: hypothetical protein AB1394_07130 [Bacteroidota bacterium]
MNNAKFETINFRFVFHDQSEKLFAIEINSDTYQIILPENISAPDWTLLKNILCPMQDCVHNNFCPLAYQLDKVIKMFDGIPSYENVTVHVETLNRTYSKQTSVQSGAGSLIGILMTTSGCYVLDKLRPMVRFHLPFATLDETEYRTFSMFLFAQFLRLRNGLEPVWKMNSLGTLYEDIMKINKNLAQRIGKLEKLDASINAVTILNNFAFSVLYSIEDEDFSKFEKLFESWLDK